MFPNIPISEDIMKHNPFFELTQELIDECINAALDDIHATPSNKKDTTNLSPSSR